MNMSRRPSEENHHIRRWFSVAFTVFIILMLLANLAVIFRFSSVNREESGEMSAGVTRFLLERIYPDYHDLSVADQAALLQRAHKFIRKAAHFSEFALLGFLSAGLFLWVSCHFSPMSLWKTWLYPAAFSLVYATSDEIHQIFTGRGPRVTDVLIDFAGACFGILLIQGISWLLARRKGRKYNIEKNEKEE